MPESLDAYAELISIRGRLDAIESGQEVLIRAQGDVIIAMILSAVSKDPMLGRIYLAVDGKRGQQEIVTYLVAQGIACSQPTVSRRLDRLIGEMGLVEVAAKTKKGATYRKSRVERVLRLTPKIERLVSVEPMTHRRQEPTP